MRAHEELGCQPSFTCAPYQTAFRPRFGEQIAWGESNAIVFANSVIGARTNRYGDFIDLCCAMTGRAPAWGCTSTPTGAVKSSFRLAGFPVSQTRSDALYVAVGLIVGALSGDRVPVIEGLPAPRDEDQLKALGAAAASSGSTALFHAIGVTPEAANFRDAFHGGAPERVETITPADISDALARLSSVPDGAEIRPSVSARRIFRRASGRGCWRCWRRFGRAGEFRFTSAPRGRRCKASTPTRCARRRSAIILFPSSTPVLT